MGMDPGDALAGIGGGDAAQRIRALLVDGLFNPAADKVRQVKSGWQWWGL